MKKEKFELHADYLISDTSYATATVLSAMLGREISQVFEIKSGLVKIPNLHGDCTA